MATHGVAILLHLFGRWLLGSAGSIAFHG
jgi:hypothetical protein